MVASHAEGCKAARSNPCCAWLSCTDLYYARGAQGPLPKRAGGATSQLDLPSVTPLSVAGCGRLQLGVPHWATSVDYCKWLIIDLTFCGSRFSAGRLLAIEDFTFYNIISSDFTFNALQKNIYQIICHIQIKYVKKVHRINANQNIVPDCELQ